VKLLLDTVIVGRICHPRKYAEVRAWLAQVSAEHEPLLSEVADYELRRELLRIGARRGLAHLDELSRELRYIPVTTATWRAAASLWALLRRTGKAAAADQALDGDVLIAAQAIADEATVVTSNKRHFEPLVPVLDWDEVPVRR